MPGRAAHRRPATLLAGTALLLLLMTAALVSPAVWRHLRAASVLVYFSHPPAQSAIPHVDSQFSTRFGSVHARTYARDNSRTAPVLLLIPGVHPLGIAEPRLNTLAQDFAAAGLISVVVAPPSLTDYRISPDSIEVIGDAAQWLHRKYGHRPGVLGISFSGGLSLMAAADPRYRDDIAFVASVGGHEDLERTMRFLVTGFTTRPDGSALAMQPNPYGALVMVYDRVDEFFSAKDLPRARQALLLLLDQEYDKSNAISRSLSPSGQAIMNKIYREDRQALQPELLQSIGRNRPELAAVSPAGHLREVNVPVLLLHGEGDTVIPPSETEWLARGLRPGVLKAVLISPEISHADVEEAPTFRDRLDLVHWLAQLLSTADRTNPQPQP